MHGHYGGLLEWLHARRRDESVDDVPERVRADERCCSHPCIGRDMYEHSFRLYDWLHAGKRQQSVVDVSGGLYAHGCYRNLFLTARYMRGHDCGL